MPISDDQVNELLSTVERIEATQGTQGTQITRLTNTVYGTEDNPGGMRQDVRDTKLLAQSTDGKITGYEDKINGAKWVIGGFVTLGGFGAVAAIITALNGGG